MDAEASPSMIQPLAEPLDTTQPSQTSASSTQAQAEAQAESQAEAQASDQHGQGVNFRSRSGCLTCRRRRVKCDERKPNCARCAIKSRQCIWADDNRSNGAASAKRRRTTGPTPSTSSTHSLTPQEGIPATTLPINPTFPDFTSADALLSLSLLKPDQLPHSITQYSDLNRAANPFPSDFDHPLRFLTNFQLPTPLQKSRFYLPPDFLPETAVADSYDTLRSNWLSNELVHPSKTAEMMADPAFLQPYFPSVEERLVMRHYLLETVHIIMAFERWQRPWNPWVIIHAPLAFNHLPGVSSAADALRTAMLAVGAVHLRYKHDPFNLRAAWKIVAEAKSKVLSHVRKAADDQDRTGVALAKGDIELIMAALLSCTIASSLAADDSWHELLTSVLQLVERLGGAESLIKEGSHDSMSSFRFFLEQLAIRDVFGCMTTGCAPTLLNTAFTPWFFEAEKWSKGDDDWESVERMFGISRGMVDVIARTCALVAKVKNTGWTLQETRSTKGKGIHSKGFDLHLPLRAVTRLNASNSPAEDTVPDEEDAAKAMLRSEAEGLIAELDVWDNACNFTPFHPKTQYGNHSYRHAIRIRLLRRVFGVPEQDPRIQAAVAAIIELCTELLTIYGKVTWLTWPILIAGLNMGPGHPMRRTAYELLAESGNHASFDIGAALSMLTDFWTRLAAQGAMSPSYVVEQKRRKPFLD